MTLALALTLVLSSSLTEGSRGFRGQLGSGFRRPPGGLIDYVTSLYLTGPTSGQICADALLTTDQGGAITVTRASVAWCQPASGNLAQINDHRAVIEADGIRVEGSSSNNVPQSEGLSVNWTATSATTGTQRGGPDGSTVTSLSTTAAGGYYESAAFTITGTSAVASAWVAGDGTGTYGFVLRDATAAVDRCTATGTPPASFPTMHVRPSCVASGTIVSGNSHVVRVYPGGAAGSGTNVSFWGVSVEPGLTVKTSYIKTSGTAASRAATVVSLTPSSMSTAGCASASATYGAAVPAGSRWVAGVGNNAAIYGINATSGGFFDGTNNIVATVSSMASRTVVGRSQWVGAASSVSLDGVAASGGFDGTVDLSTVYLGAQSNGTTPLNGWLKKLKLSTDPNGCIL